MSLWMESGKKPPMDYSSNPEAEWVALAQSSLVLARGKHALGSGLSSSLFLLLPIFFLLALRILLLLVSTSTLAFCLNPPA